MSPQDPPGARPLSGYRESIDRLDRDFIRLLAQRMDLVRQIGDLKKSDPASPLRDEDREREIFEVWARLAKENGLSPYFVGRLLRELLNYSRRDQERLLDRPQDAAAGVAVVRVGYQGVAGSYSDLTITKLFASRHVERLERIGFHGFGAVMDALEGGQIEYALLPIENTVAGSINEVYDLLAHRQVTIVGEEVWPVEHCLLGLPGAQVETLRAIRSHPVALQQCLHFLEGLVGTRQESYFDTAGSAESVAREKDPTLGAIASEEAGRLWGLSVLRRRVADQDVNLTRFLLIGREPEPVDPRRPAKTSLVMVVRHQPGALLECLRIFDDLGINLSKLESRPVPERPWAYRFYVDFEGHAELEPAASALKALKRSTSRLKVLGTYARRTDPEAAVPTVKAVVAEKGEVPLAAPVSRQAVPSAQIAAEECLPVRAGDVELGGELFVVIADLAPKESQRQLVEGAALAKELGARMLAVRAPAQRSGGEGSYSPQLVDRLTELSRAFELPLIVEVLQPEDVQRLARGVAMFQVGSRNMQNQALLQELGRAALPVLLHRGLSSTVEDLLRAAESIEAGGNHQVVLCERGIRTFETATAATLDLAAVPWLKERSHLPVIVDPGRATGSPVLLAPLARAVAAVGADGLILPVEGAAADLAAPPPALDGGQLQALVASLVPILRALGRRF